MCLPAPVYSVSDTTKIASSGSSCAYENAAASAVFPAGPLSIPSRFASISVIYITSPCVTVRYLSMYLSGRAAERGTSEWSGSVA